MASWAERLGDRIKGKLGGVGSYGFDDALTEAIRETIEEAAQHCYTHYDASGVAQKCAADILAMLSATGDSKEETP